jgi:serine/threonine protein kinase
VTLRTLIVDSSADFRAVLRVLLLREWPGVQVTEWDPAVKGRPQLDTLSGTVDLVLLGHDTSGPGATWTEDSIAACRTPMVVLSESDPGAIANLGVTLGKREVSQATLAAAIGRSLAADGRTLPSAPSLAPAAGPAAALPATIGGFRIVRQIARGGMSTIYLAERPNQAGECALKLLDPALTNDDSFLRRFFDEYALLGKLDSRHVAAIYDQGITDDHVYIAMEYFANGDLKARLASHMEPEAAVAMLREIAEALVVVHSAGIVHRDLKPDNIMFRSDGSLALIDFGIAREASTVTTITRQGQVLGTPYYISPEQCLDQPVDGRADVYSAGVIFYEALTGDRPFKASSIGGLLHQQVHLPPPPLPASLQRYQGLIEHLLAKSAEQRLTAAELLAVLKIDFALAA